eukprot:1365162-Lingulodinium_polyedra.AAC.1
MGALKAFAASVGLAPCGARVAPPAALTVMPFRSERARFMAQELHFDCTPFLPVFEAAAFVEPRLLRLPEPRPTDARRPRPERDEQLIAYARSWDAVQKLHLARPEEVREPFGLIAAFKDDKRDRIVSDRRRANAWEAHLEGASRDMASGADLCEFEVPSGHVLRVMSDDLMDMFCAFDCSPAHALTNGLAV